MEIILHTGKKMNMNSRSINKTTLFLGNMSSVTSSLCGILSKRSYYICTVTQNRSLYHTVINFSEKPWQVSIEGGPSDEDVTPKAGNRIYSSIYQFPYVFVHSLTHTFIPSLNKHLLRAFFVQSPSPVWLYATPWAAACLPSLSLTVSQSFPKFMSIALEMPSSHLILSCSLLLYPQSFPESGAFPMSQLFASGDQNTELQLQSFQWVFRVDFL